MRLASCGVLVKDTRGSALRCAPALVITVHNCRGDRRVGTIVHRRVKGGLIIRLI